MIRCFLASLVCSAVLLEVNAAVSADAARAEDEKQRPNVLFIAVDDLNDWIGCLGGYPGCKSPHIDSLANRGVLFTKAYCAAPACNPSRVALMTGLRPSTSGIYTNPQPWRPALPEVVTLPQHFMAHGYHAVGCGKIFHGRYPDLQSWHAYQERGKDPKPTEAVLKNPHSQSNGVRWGVLDVDDEQMNDYKMTSFAIDYLKQSHDKPFFLACGIFRPHMPWQVPRKYYDMYPLDEITLPEVLDTDLDDVPELGRKMARPNGDHRRILEDGNWRYAVQAYLASITFADAQVGRLMEALDESPYADNTIVILWGDHGWHLGEKLHWRKFSLWEEATRAPLMMTAPGVTNAGGVCNRTVEFTDIYPTLAELCGHPVGEHLDGKSLLPLLKNPESAWDTPALTTFGRNNHTVRSERFRYIRYADGSEELYDHENDPMEWTNLADAAEHADVKQKLSAWLPKTNAEEAPRDGRLRRNRR